MKVLITGAAGFIGSNLTDRLLGEGHEVVGVDNLSTGQRRFLSEAETQSHFSFHERDLVDPRALREVLTGDIEWVIHLAANADVRFGLAAPTRDLEQNTIVTSNVLEAMRTAGVKNVAFSSTGSIYGEAAQIPTPETCPFPIQTSLYGASKLACEGMIAAYAEGYGFRARIYRFVSILGPRYTHGHVFDFLRHLINGAATLPVLGNGLQRKSYLHVEDCVSAILHTLNRPEQKKVEIYNLGQNEYVTVNDSIDVIFRTFGARLECAYSGGDRGWVGDNPFIFLDASKVRATGWQPRWSIRDAVADTVKYLLENRWVMDAR